MDEAAFAELPSLIARQLGAINSVMYLTLDGLPVELATTASQEAQRAYLGYYVHKDIWALPNYHPTDVVLSRTADRMSEQAVLESEFYQDYARHLNMWQPIGSLAPISTNEYLCIGLNRPRGAATFSAAEEAAFLDITGHVQRALQLRRRFRSSRAQQSVGYAALDRLDFATLIVDRRGKLVFLNAQAEAFGRAGVIVLKEGRLTLSTTGDAAMLQALLASTCRGGPGGAIRVAHTNPGFALVGLVSPLPQTLHDREADGLALVCIRNSRADSNWSEMLLIQIFGLSPQEGHVASAIAAGAKIEQIAAERGVKPTTVKTQLEAVLRKTGAETQRDLVRLVASLPQVR